MEPGTEPISIEGSTLAVGERVVYPNQGVCRISGIEVKEIGGVRGEFLTMKREEDGATVMVPRAKVSSIGLRHVANRSEIEDVLGYLEADAGDPELDWKVRHRTHADKMVGGSLLGTAEVLKGLHSLALLRPLPQRERELYDSARHLLVGEIAVSLGLPPCSAEDAIDICLTPPAGSARAEAQAQRMAAALEAALGLGDVDDIEEGAAPDEAALDEAPAAEARPAKRTKPTVRAAGAAKKPKAAKARPAPKAKAAAKTVKPKPTKTKATPKPVKKAPKKAARRGGK
ncbi:MAG: CarD family transcriptional regulator [Deltaproteobacteria bacterium]